MQGIYSNRTTQSGASNVSRGTSVRYEDIIRKSGLVICTTILVIIRLARREDIPSRLAVFITQESCREQVSTFVVAKEQVVTEWIPEVLLAMLLNPRALQ